MQPPPPGWIRALVPSMLRATSAGTESSRLVIAAGGSYRRDLSSVLLLSNGECCQIWLSNHKKKGCFTSVHMAIQPSCYFLHGYPAIMRLFTRLSSHHATFYMAIHPSLLGITIQPTNMLKRIYIATHQQVQGVAIQPSGIFHRAIQWLHAFSTPGPFLPLTELLPILSLSQVTLHLPTSSTPACKCIPHSCHDM